MQSIFNVSVGMISINDNLHKYSLSAILMAILFAAVHSIEQNTGIRVNMISLVSHALTIFMVTYIMN